jgi:hypothetical protein
VTRSGSGYSLPLNPPCVHPAYSFLVLLGCPLSHTISFRRPELPYVLSTMSVPPESDVMEHIRRLKDLGYKIIAVTPPLNGYGPPQNPNRLELSFSV